MTASVTAASSARLTLRFALPLLLVLLGAAAALTYHCNAAINRTLTEAAERRAAVVLLDIGQGIETRLNLGLPLASMHDVQDVLERERAKDGQILSIEVFDDAGRSLFNTDRGLIGDRVPAGWVDLTRDEHHGLWITNDFEAVVVGTDFTNSFDKTVGGVALRYSREAFDAVERAALARIGGGAAAVAALTAALLLLGVWLVLRGYNLSVGDALARFSRDPAATGRPLPAATLARIGDIDRVRLAIDEADRSLAAASADVQSIDEEA